MPAVSAVLTFESMMALMACLNPSSTAVRTSLPCCSSSRMRSKMSTLASTAMPTDSTRPASPGRVRVEPDQAVLTDVALEDRRLTLHAVVQDDGHVVVNVAAGLALELAAARARQHEVHDRLVGHLVAPGRGLLELLAGDDGPVLDGVQRAVRPRPTGRRLGAPLELDAPRDEPPHLGPGEQALRPGHLLLGDEVLARHPALEQERRERPGPVQVGRVL